MVIFAFIGSTFIYLAYPFAQGFWHFALLAFGMSSVMSAYAVSVKALTVELLPKSDRGRHMEGSSPRFRWEASSARS